MLLEILDLRKKPQSDSIITSPNYLLREYQLDLLFCMSVGKICVQVPKV